MSSTIPARRGVAITPSDSTVLAITRGIYVGGNGNLVVTMIDGGVLTFTGVLAGMIYPLQVSKVMAATTATGLIGLA